MVTLLWSISVSPGESICCVVHTYLYNTVLLSSIMTPSSLSDILDIFAAPPWKMWDWSHFNTIQGTTVTVRLTARSTDPHALWSRGLLISRYSYKPKASDGLHAALADKLHIFMYSTGVSVYGFCQADEYVTSLSPDPPAKVEDFHHRRFAMGWRVLFSS